jgi:hypothetical protein
MNIDNQDDQDIFIPVILNIHVKFPLLDGVQSHNMSPLSADTPPEIERIQLDIIRRMPSLVKFALLNDLNETVKAFSLSGIRQCSPNATPEQKSHPLVGLILGEELG